MRGRDRRRMEVICLLCSVGSVDLRRFVVLNSRLDGAGWWPMVAALGSRADGKQSDGKVGLLEPVPPPPPPTPPPVFN